MAMALGVAGGGAWAQAAFSATEGVLRIPSVTVGSLVYTQVVLKLEADGRFSLVAAVPPESTTSPGSGSTQAQTFALNYVPQANTQYGYDEAGQRKEVACAALPQAQMHLRVPARSAASQTVPLVLALGGWALTDPLEPVGEDAQALEELSVAGVAVLTFQYRACADWSNPMIMRTTADEDHDTSNSDLGQALSAVRAFISQNGLPVDLQRIVAVGTSYSSNLIFTAAVKHELQGALALLGGCDYNCEVTGNYYEQPNDFRVKGQAIAVGAISGANDTAYAPAEKGDAGYGAPAARARILGAIGSNAAAQPRAFYTHLEPDAGHERTMGMWDKARQFLRCITGLDAETVCAADNR